MTIRPGRILASVGLALLFAACLSSLAEVRGLFRKPHSVLLALSDATKDQCVVEGGELTSTGRDAKLVWNGFSGEDVRLDVEVDADEEAFLDAFWGTPDQPAFSPARCVRRTVSPGTHRLAVPIGGGIRRLRLDFGSEPGQSFRIASVRARSGFRLARPWAWRAFFLRTALLLLPFLPLAARFFFPAVRIWTFADRNRFALAAAVLLLAVALELHGSSIGMWNRHVPNAAEEPPLLGVERPIRADEWAVFTPMTLAQSFAEPAWPYFNGIPRAARTDMFSVYAQPVRHPLAIFRPFLAGHVLLGFGRGLSFFWFGRWIALFLAMYGLFRLSTDGDRPLSAVAALLVVLSPVVQWWGAINALAEMLVFGSLFVLCLDRFMAGRRLRERWLPIVGMGYAGVSYAMTLYPAAMVPLAYVFAALSVWVVVRRAGDFRADAATWAFAAVAAAAAAGCLAWYLALSADSFRTMGETVYPGQRLDCGGGFARGFGLSLGALFFPWTSHWVEDGNVFEWAAFLDFCPLGVGLFAFLRFRRGVRDPLSLCLVSAFVLLSLYCVAGFPRWLADATLLSRSMARRAFVALGFVQLLLLVRSVSLLSPSLSIGRSAAAAAATGLVSAGLAHLAYPTYLSPGRLAALGALAGLSALCLLRFREGRRASSAFLALVAVAMGGFVNPVQHGDAGVPDSALNRAIRSVAGSSEGAWLVESEPFPMNQYPLLAGAPTVNAGNLYPAVGRWRDMDPTERYREVWNRYAIEIRADLVPGEGPSFELTTPDSFRIGLPPEALPRLGVRHVLSRRDLTALPDGDVRLLPERRVSGWTIYSVEDARNPATTPAAPSQRPRDGQTTLASAPET